MEPQDHKARRERLREVYDELKREGKIKNNRDFFSPIPSLNEGDRATMINPNAKKNVSLPPKYYPRLCAAWNINPEYLESGRWPAFKPDPNKMLQLILDELQEIKELLQKKK